MPNEQDEQPPTMPPNLNGEQLPFWNLLKFMQRQAERVEDQAIARDNAAIARDNATNTRIDRYVIAGLTGFVAVMATVLGVGLA